MIDPKDNDELRDDLKEIVACFGDFFPYMDGSTSDAEMAEKGIDAIMHLISTQVVRAQIESAKIVAYRLDNRIDFNQNKISWEVVDEYTAQLNTELTRLKSQRKGEE